MHVYGANLGVYEPLPELFADATRVTHKRLLELRTAFGLIDAFIVLRRRSDGGGQDSSWPPPSDRPSPVIPVDQTESSRLKKLL
jgi:hypothetical protein